MVTEPMAHLHLEYCSIYTNWVSMVTFLGKITSVTHVTVSDMFSITQQWLVCQGG